MTYTTTRYCCLLALLAWGCGSADRLPPQPLDCAAGDAFEFANVSDFSGSDTGWFQYADNTPGGVPDPLTEGSNVPVAVLDAPGRCGDLRFMKLEAEGHNFWGAGFGDWAHNEAASRADGTGYEGLSFWARSPANAEKTFLLHVDDGRTIVLPPDPPETGGLPVATNADQDRDGDGFVGPGDVARGTRCLLPPPEELGDAACYDGGLNEPSSAGTRVPEPNECGNSFHVLVTTRQDWQLFFVPWRQLIQWPCPNRLEGGIDISDIAKFEIELLQGTRYEIWIDNISFYRRR